MSETMSFVPKREQEKILKEAKARTGGERVGWKQDEGKETPVYTMGPSTVGALRAAREHLAAEDSAERRRQAALAAREQDQAWGREKEVEVATEHNEWAREVKKQAKRRFH